MNSLPHKPTWMCAVSKVVVWKAKGAVFQGLVRLQLAGALATWSLSDDNSACNDENYEITCKTSVEELLSFPLATTLDSARKKPKEDQQQDSNLFQRCLWVLPEWSSKFLNRNLRCPTYDTFALRTVATTSAFLEDVAYIPYISIP